MCGTEIFGGTVVFGIKEMWYVPGGTAAYVRSGIVCPAAVRGVMYGVEI